MKNWFQHLRCAAVIAMALQCHGAAIAQAEEVDYSALLDSLLMPLPPPSAFDTLVPPPPPPGVLVAQPVEEDTSLENENDSIREERERMELCKDILIYNMTGDLIWVKKELAERVIEVVKNDSELLLWHGNWLDSYTYDEYRTYYEGHIKPDSVYLGVIKRAWDVEYCKVYADYTDAQGDRKTQSLNLAAVYVEREGKAVAAAHLAGEKTKIGTVPPSFHFDVKQVNEWTTLVADAGEYLYDGFDGEDFKIAATKYETAVRMFPNYPRPLRNLAECYMRLAEYSRGVECAEKALALDGGIDYVVTAAKLHCRNGSPEKGLEYLDEALAEHPDYAYGYCVRAMCHEAQGRLDLVLEDIDKAIKLGMDELVSTKVAVLLLIATSLEKKGNHSEALEYHRQVVALDTVPNKNSYAAFSLLALGRREEAKVFMVRAIAADRWDKVVYYNAACLYSRMDERKTAVRLLSRALEFGFGDMKLIAKQSDLDNIRDMPEFKALMEEYKDK